MKEWLKNLWAKLNTEASELWKNNKIFLIVFGVVILVIKFRSVLIDLLISDSNAIFKKTTEQSNQLSKAEDKANDQADALIKNAEDLGKQSTEVTDDWYTKK